MVFQALVQRNYLLNGAWLCGSFLSVLFSKSLRTNNTSFTSPNSSFSISYQGPRTWLTSQSLRIRIAKADLQFLLWRNWRGTRGTKVCPQASLLVRHVLHSGVLLPHCDVLLFPPLSPSWEKNCRDDECDAPILLKSEKFFSQRQEPLPPNQIVGYYIDTYWSIYSY